MSVNGIESPIERATGYYNAAIVSARFTASSYALPPATITSRMAAPSRADQYSAGDRARLFKSSRANDWRGQA